MRDINPGGQGVNPANKPNKVVINQAGAGSRPIIPAEQARRYVAPTQSVKREYFQPKPNTGGKKFLALSLFLSLILISIIFFLATFAFDGATITIKPLTRKDLGLNETFVVSELDRKDLLLNKNIQVSESITVAKKSVKKVFRKAEGDVMIYNDFGKDPQKFVKGTRLQTADDKIFKITTDVVVPGKVGNTPGSIKAHVQADTDGVEYNIGPTKFTVPGLKATPKYKGFYAESSATMKGGASGNESQVSDADLQKAITDVKQKLVVAAQESIGKDVPEGFTYNKETLTLTVGKIQKTSEDDSTATYIQNATATTLFFKRDEIVKRILEKQEANNISKPIVKVLDSNNLVISVSNQGEALDEKSQITLTVTGPAPAVFYPNKQEILEYYAGRPVSEFNDIAKKFKFVESAKRVIYPFWNTSFPSNISKITVTFEE
jgi:hypothetical protein